MIQYTYMSAAECVIDKQCQLMVVAIMLKQCQLEFAWEGIVGANSD